MNNALLYIGMLLEGISCSSNEVCLQNGDLLFQAGKSSIMTNAIIDATAKNEELSFSHVAIAVVENGADSVLEASTDGGVRLVSLGEFLSSAGEIGGYPAVVAFRLRDNSQAAAAVSRARLYLGEPYDYSFLPDNGGIYCSELVWESYLTTNGAHIFTARPMNFRNADGLMPQFWVELFAQLGEPIPENILGTNPNDMSKESLLREIYRWF